MKKLFRITSCRMMIYKHHVKSYYIATSHFTNILLYYNSSSFSQRYFLGQIFKYINKRKKNLCEGAGAASFSSKDSKWKVLNRIQYTYQFNSEISCKHVNTRERAFLNHLMLLFETHIKYSLVWRLHHMQVIFSGV